MKSYCKGDVLSVMRNISVSLFFIDVNFYSTFNFLRISHEVWKFDSSIHLKTSGNSLHYALYSIYLKFPNWDPCVLYLYVLYLHCCLKMSCPLDRFIKIQNVIPTIESPYTCCIQFYFAISSKVPPIVTIMALLMFKKLTIEQVKESRHLYHWRWKYIL